jgi:regulatory protein
VSSFRKRAPKGRASASQSDDAAAAELAAVTLLARRDFGCQELGERLRERGFEDALIGALVSSLQERGLLDDARFAAHFVAYRSGRGQGPERIQRELADLGVGAALIEEAIGAGPDWLALAREVRRRRFGPQAPQDWAEKARQSRFLQYRGFSNDHIRVAVGPDPDFDS